MKPSESEMK